MTGSAVRWVLCSRSPRSPGQQAPPAPPVVPAGDGAVAASLRHLWEQGGPALPPAWGHSCCTGGSVWGTFSPPCSHPSDGAEPGDGAGGCCPLRVLPVPLSGFYSLTGSGVAAWDLLSSSHHTPAHPPWGAGLGHPRLSPAGASSRAALRAINTPR